MKYQHDTIAIALAELARQGYSIDFSSDKYQLLGAGNNYEVSNFRINEIYHYEGNLNCDDDVIIFAIESTDGIKGVFVSGHPASNSPATNEIIAALKKATARSNSD